MNNQSNKHQRFSAPPSPGDSAEADRTAFDEIAARGENPENILRAFDLMDARLRAKHLPRRLASIAPEPEGCAPIAMSARGIGNAIYFEELVAAGTPTPGGGAEGRPATVSDVMQGIDPNGKMFIKISGSSMTGTSIEDGDIALVDPKAEIRDGDLVLANLAGRGQVVKRLRLAEDGSILLESENPDFAPIKVNEPADLRIHGKVLWRGGPVR